MGSVILHLQASSGHGILTFGKGLVGIWDIGLNHGNHGMLWDGMELKAHPEPSLIPGCSKSFPTCPWIIPGMGSHKFMENQIPNSDSFPSSPHHWENSPWTTPGLHGKIPTPRVQVLPVPRRSWRGSGAGIALLVCQ